MSGANALRELGPSGICRAALCVCIAAVCFGGGCAPPAPPLPAVPPGVAPEPDARRLTELETELASGSPDSIAAAALRSAGITPPFERRFVLNSAAGPLVAGLIPGGAPGLRDSLVVAIAVGPNAAAALLEAARWVAERAAYQPGPPRTLMVALAISGSALESDPTAALTRTLSTPLWDPARISTVIMIGRNATSAAAAVRERGLLFVPVDPPAGASRGSLALEAYSALLEAAAGHGALAPDSTSTSG